MQGLDGRRGITHPVRGGEAVLQPGASSGRKMGRPPGQGEAISLAWRQGQSPLVRSF